MLCVVKEADIAEAVVRGNARCNVSPLNHEDCRGSSARPLKMCCFSPRYSQIRDVLCCLPVPGCLSDCPAHSMGQLRGAETPSPHCPFGWAPSRAQGENHHPQPPVPEGVLPAQGHSSSCVRGTRVLMKNISYYLTLLNLR